MKYVNGVCSRRERERKPERTMVSWLRCLADVSHSPAVRRGRTARKSNFRHTRNWKTRVRDLPPFGDFQPSAPVFVGASHALNLSRFGEDTCALLVSSKSALFLAGNSNKLIQSTVSRQSHDWSLRALVVKCWYH